MPKKRPQLSVKKEDLSSVLGPLGPPDGDLGAMVAAVHRPRRRAVRLNPLGRPVEPDALPFPTEPIAGFGPTARSVIGPARPGGHLLYATGSYYVQDAGSLLPVAALDVRPGMRVCDLCASPGGKATALLERLGETGGVLVNEPIRSRIGALRLNLARHGSTRYTISRMDPAALGAALGGQFDAVLVDAPCTGQSLAVRTRRHAQAYADGAVRHCAVRQRRILDAAAELVAPGGHLVYATCTFSWAENEQQVIDLIKRSPEWTIEPAAELAPWQAPPPAPEGCYRLWPHLHDSAGAFACRLRRDESASVSTRSPQRRFKPNRVPLDGGQWRTDTIVRCGANRCDVWPEDVPPVLTGVDGPGPEAAFRKGRTWFPAYALAMRRDGRYTPDQTLELTHEEALAYVQGRPIPHGVKGWCVVTHQTKPLGWGRGSGREIANHLPPSARIRNPLA